MNIFAEKPTAKGHTGLVYPKRTIWIRQQSRLMCYKRIRTSELVRLSSSARPSSRASQAQRQAGPMWVISFSSLGRTSVRPTTVHFYMHLYANIIRISQQIEFFKQYQDRVSAMIGPVETKRLVNGALVLIVLGGNDFVNNYFFTPYSVRRLQYSVPEFSSFLISEYRKILMRLYELGARRVLVPGTGPLGCVPAELATQSTDGECAEEPQQAAQIFNPQLIQMITDLNQKLGSDVFVTANSMKMHSDFISNPQAFGFVTSKMACCGQGPYNGVGVCNPISNLCPNRKLYAFWDPFHPTEKANRIIVQQMITGSSEYMHPMNLSTIMAMDSRN